MFWVVSLPSNNVWTGGGRRIMFKVYFYNFEYYSSREGKTLEEAKEIAREAGFQSAISNEAGEVVASWCCINGFQKIYPISNSTDPNTYLRPIEDKA